MIYVNSSVKYSIILTVNGKIDFTIPEKDELMYVYTTNSTVDNFVRLHDIIGFVVFVNTLQLIIKTLTENYV